jgi:hypothetical protein
VARRQVPEAFLQRVGPRRSARGPTRPDRTTPGDTSFGRNPLGPHRRACRPSHVQRIHSVRRGTAWRDGVTHGSGGPVECRSGRCVAAPRSTTRRSTVLSTHEEPSKRSARNSIAGVPLSRATECAAERADLVADDACDEPRRAMGQGPRRRRARQPLVVVIVAVENRGRTRPSRQPPTVTAPRTRPRPSSGLEQEGRGLKPVCRCPSRGSLAGWFHRIVQRRGRTGSRPPRRGALRSAVARSPG